MHEASGEILFYAGSKGLARQTEVNEAMRVLLADDEPSVRLALRLLLQQERDLIVAGEAGNWDDLLEQTAANCPDLVLLDWELPGGKNKMVLILALRSLRPGLKIIALDIHPQTRQAALSAGADDFICKRNPPEHLLEALNHCRAKKSG
jgi:DNA-binding NarL/FixJ family response regulator